ncbi:MAG: UvrD-helicase domain-containing protein [Clostridia bacterium]|nr:UvrD-helicase domain-containing protein [Clostridia bacterium]
MEEKSLALLKKKLESRKKDDKKWYLDLLDRDKQTEYETDHLAAVLLMLKIRYIRTHLKKIERAKEERNEIVNAKDYSAENYRALIEKNAEIAAETKKLNAFQCFFSEPYFARIDVVDDKEGYNAYYIGKKGDINLSIVDWRAPLAVRYYQKSRVNFAINEYEYRTVMRRALYVKNGKLLDFKNEYLSVREALSEEEIAGRDEEILFDPYLRSIIASRKDDLGIRDIIRTIQEQQFEIITRPERESFVLQGCAGSGKTMILLHRLSYLMYNNEKLAPRDVLVITPSDSFNDFIDELAKTLELGLVKTITLKNFYARVLENEGIDFNEKLKEGTGEETEEYLSYLYSESFVKDIKKRVDKFYDDIYGLFSGQECREVAGQILADCGARAKKYTKIKNASPRIRRAVLGEMKERIDGGFAFTKPFRAFMSAFSEVEDFLGLTLNEERKTPDYFFRQFMRFYKSARLVSTNAEKIFRKAEEDLNSLSESVRKEIADLRRYRVRHAQGEVYTYADRISKREELLEEIEAAKTTVEEMVDGVDLFCEFFSVVRFTRACEGLGRCEDSADIARWLYRETVKSYKKKYGVMGLCPSDGYALCQLLAATGRKLTPRYGLVFIDEGQDISQSEYDLLKYINSDAAFNIFGDVKQNITSWRGVKDWAGVERMEYRLDRNYRNTNEIVEFVTREVGAEMTPIGLHGEKVSSCDMKKLNAFFKDKQGLRAVIAKEEYLPLFVKRGYSLLKKEGKISKTNINVMSVYESKGLEFSAVAVYTEGMTENEKYIAYTRALKDLTVVK